MSALAVTLIGATGLTGSKTLDALLQTKTTPIKINTIARKAISPSPASHADSSHTHTLVTDLRDAKTEKVIEEGGVLISCLGTTRAIAGGMEKQREIELGINGDIARKAKEDGAKAMILITSANSSPDSRFGYVRLKGDQEEMVKSIGFEHTILVRPAMILGPRSESRPTEYIFQNVFRGLRGIGLPTSSLAVDAEDIGQCIAYLSVNLPKDKVTIVGNAQIINNAKLWREANGVSK